MIGWPWVRSSPRQVVWLALGIGLSVVLLAWFSIRASREWQRSSALLVERRANESASLLVTALKQDMRAVQVGVLASPVWEEFTIATPEDATTLVGSAFARYPYPEAFFAWNEGDRPARLQFFSRTERPPAWSAPVKQANRYPVRTSTDDRVGASIRRFVDEDAARGHTLSVSEIAIDGIPYQVVARLRYRDRFHQHLAGAHGFMVNLPWVREHYFPELARQMIRIGGDDVGLALGIIDDSGGSVVTTSAFVDNARISRRTFPVLFLDPFAAAVNPPVRMPYKSWTVIASGAADPTLAAAISGANRTAILAAAAAAALGIGLVLSARAVRAGAEVSDMRADFVSSVTHELKTPIASIRALGDTISSGRVSTPGALRDYAALVVQEAKRLSRLVDNLLAYAKVTDIAAVYAFEAVDLGPLVQSALDNFGSQLRDAGFELDVDLPDDLPPVAADRAALELVFDNLIDNAIRYSTGTKALSITADRHDGLIAVRLADRGQGIAPDEIPHVTQKFVRGRQAVAGGSGLGLAIVKRVITDHHGSLSIKSELGRGTVVTVGLPVARRSRAA